MGAFAEDLRFAQATGVAVEVHLLSGQVFKLVGVRDVDEERNVVNLHTPETYGDDLTTTKVDLDLIASVKVTDVPWT